MIETDRITPDKHQPRKVFDPERVSQIAVSYALQGMINPIEVDKDRVIVTGEQRWRAAVEAGLEKVPCRIIDPGTADERFVRQVIENIHHNTMTLWDTAKALERCHRILLVEKGWKPRGTEEKGWKDLGTLLGISPNLLSSIMMILQGSPSLQAIGKTNTLTVSHLKLLRQCQPQHRAIMDAKIVSGEMTDCRVWERLLAHVRKYPEHADRIFAYDFRGWNTLKLMRWLEEEYPSHLDQHENDRQYFQAVRKQATALENLIAQRPQGSMNHHSFLSFFDKNATLTVLHRLQSLLPPWIEGVEQVKELPPDIVDIPSA